MTPDQVQELVDSMKRIAYLLEYLCLAVKEIAAANLAVPLDAPAAPSTQPKR